MARKQLLHELLNQDQEPFQLHNYISDRRSQLKKPLPSSAPKLQVRKRKPCNSFSRHACFFSLQNSPDVLRKSPFRDFPISPAKSPAAAVLLHVPAGTAAHLVEAALRIQKQRPKPKPGNLGLGLFGSFLKRLKDRSRNKNRAIQNHGFRQNGENCEHEEKEPVRVSTYSNRRLSSVGWTDNNEDKSMDFEASTSGYGSDCSEDVISDFDLPESRFCLSPFVFSFHRSPSSAGRRTPDFCSPASSPAHPMKKEKESYDHHSQNSGEVLGQEDEDKEQCSPVSVLDPPFEEDDDGRESGDAHLDDYHDLECSYANVQRAKEQLLHRLRRFEKLAELDPLELDEEFPEASDDDILDKEAEDDEPLPPLPQAFVTQVSNHYLDMMSPDMDKDEIIRSGDNRRDLWKEAELNMIEMTIRLDLTKERGGWITFREQVEDTAADIELAIFGVLLEELLEEEVL